MGDSGVSSTVNVTVSDVVNILPTVEITAPADSAEFNAGDTIMITASASDSDGTISSVVFYNGTTLLSTDTAAPYTYAINSAAEGSYSLKCIAIDNSGDTGVSSIVNVTVKGGSSDLLSKYGVPTADPFQSLVKKFSSIVTEGTDAPDLSEVNEVMFNWDLANKGLWDFGVTTTKGKPSWYVDLKAKIKHTFESENPGCTISDSGFDGLDGEYYITMDGENMVMVEKTGKYAVIFQP